MKLLYQGSGSGISLRAESDRDIVLLGRLSVKTKTEVSHFSAVASSGPSVESTSLRLSHDALLATLLEVAAK